MFLSNLAHLDIFFQTLKTEIFSLLIKKTINEKYQFSHEEESIIFFDKESNKKICFDLDNNNPLNVIEEIEQFFKCCYIPGKGLYYDNFLELLISDSRIYFIDGLSTQFEHFYGEQEHSSEEQIITSDKIFFEIGGLSNHLDRFISLYLESDYICPSDLTSIKIYNINKNINVEINQSEFLDKANAIVYSILFDLSHKYLIELRLIELSEQEEEYEFETVEKIINIKDHFFKRLYDQDLSRYYYRAIQMQKSEFKYLAFYQVIECIYDEVYLSETVVDLKQIMSANWFSFYDDEHIAQIIKLVEQYNKNKNDKEKLILVLKKYFKGNVHDQVYYETNKDIIEILKRIRKIKTDSDLNDLQKLADAIYDFRCKSTHSNRAFNFKSIDTETKDNLADYILLIQKVAERIIINYNLLGTKN